MISKNKYYVTTRKIPTYIKYLLVKKQGGRLPSGYQEVEYIESTGEQYIDTGFILYVNNGFFIDFVPENDPTSSNAPNYINAGGSGGVSDERVQINTYVRSGTNLSGELQFFDKKNIDPKIIKNQRTTISVIDKFLTYGNGTTEELVTSYANPTKTSMIIFASYNQALTQIYRFSKMKLYNLKLYNSNEVVRDYIPCYRKSDGEIGLYEIIEGRFLTNQGSGTFNKGLDK